MLQDIFNALTSGTNQAGNQPQANTPGQAGGDVLSGLLGSLMGGNTQAAPAQTTQPAQTGGNELEGLLGSLLGGGQTGAAQTAAGQVTGNPLMNLIGSGQNPMINSLLQPVVDQIATKLGVSPTVAMTVVTSAVHYMLMNHGNKLANGENLSGVLQQHTNQDFLHSTGLTNQLAAQTGMQPSVAANALSEVFKLLGGSSQTKQ